MQSKLLIHNIWFRIITPAILGLLAYLLILMSSDRIDQLLTVFFGSELIITVITAYLVITSLRWTIILFFNLQAKEDLDIRKMFLQTILTIAIGAVFSTIPLIVYMKYLLGYSNFSKEITLFVIIFSFFSLFYNVLYFSLYFLNLKNNSALDYENQLRDSLIKEYKGFVRDIHPDFFYMGLETLIVLIRKDKNQADKFINKFSGVFRYIIDCKKQDLAIITNEMAHLKDLIFVFNQKYDNQIILENKLDKDMATKHVVPCTIQCLLELVVLSSIITRDCPLHIEIYKEEEDIIFKHNGLARINEGNKSNELKHISDTQKYLSGRPIMVEQEGKTTLYRIPVLLNEIEPLE